MPSSNDPTSPPTTASESPGVRPLLKRFWPWLRPHRRFLWWIVFLSLLSKPVSLVSPLIVSRLIDDSVQSREARELMFWSSLLVGMTVLTVVFNLLLGYATTIFNNRLLRDLRLNLYVHMQKLSLRYYSEQETGTLMSRQTDDVGNLRGVMPDTLARAALDALMTLIFAGLLFYLEWRLAAVAIAVIVLIFGFQLAISGELRVRTRTERERWTDLSRALHQALSGQYLIRATAAEDREAARFSKALRKSVRAIFRKELFQLVTNHFFGFIATLAPVLIILLGVWMIRQEQMSVGELFAFFMYLGHFFGSAMAVAGVNPALQSSLASLERIYEIFDTQPEVEASATGTELARLEGEVVFEDIGFGYEPDKPVLDGISLRVPARTTVALVGPSGSGKTTLAHLVPRFFDPDSGRVKIDGHDLADLDLRWLRRKIGLVPQQVFLLDRSIAENIRYGRPEASLEQVREAARAARALKFIESLPEGFDTMVGEQGVKLSGGQRQRLAIAREILSDPAILILDEATSALDSETETLIQEALSVLLEKRTALVIAHRLSTVVEADQIVVLDKGRIVEQGPHDELADAGGLYSRLYRSQFSRGE